MDNQHPLHTPYLPGDSSVETVDRSLVAREATIQMLKKNLGQAQLRMKQYADAHRSEREFNVGDWVYLRLQPYRQASVHNRSNHKLSAKFYGPYPVLAKVGPVAYTLQLPSTSTVHPTFHVSMLKKHHGIFPHTLPALPDDVSKGTAVARIPESVLDKRVFKKQGRMGIEWLVKWKHSLPEDATWEDAHLMASWFPAFDPWGHVSA